MLQALRLWAAVHVLEELEKLRIAFAHRRIEVEQRVAFSVYGARDGVALFLGHRIGKLRWVHPERQEDGRRSIVCLQPHCTAELLHDLVVAAHGGDERDQVAFLCIDPLADGLARTKDENLVVGCGVKLLQDAQAIPLRHVAVQRFDPPFDAWGDDRKLSLASFREIQHGIGVGTLDTAVEREAPHVPRKHGRLDEELDVIVGARAIVHVRSNMQSNVLCKRLGLAPFVLVLQRFRIRVRVERCAVVLRRRR